MNKEYNFETFLSISSKKFSIYLFDKNTFNNFYKEEIKIENQNENINLEILNKFLNENIFKIEKLIGEFVKNISIIIENYEVFDFKIGIKKKNYESTISKKIFETTLTEVKDLFKENYLDKKIMHIIISKYLINDNYHYSFKDDLIGDSFAVEIQIKSISVKLATDINKVLENYHIKINQYLDKNYIKNFYKNENIKLSEMAYKIKNGINENEVKLVPKNLKKMGFFEKFFQLFS